MKQWTTLMDGIDNLQLEVVQEPTKLKDDEVLVKISRISLNHRDAKLINGDFKDSYGVPSQRIVPTSDACGTITRLGGAVATTRWKIGDRVISTIRPAHLTGPTRAEYHAQGLGIPQPGVLAEYRVFPASGLIAVPEYLTDEEACTLPVAATTAWMALNWDRPINAPRRGDGIAEALGMTSELLNTFLLIYFFKRVTNLDPQAIITSSSDAKIDHARKLGADYAINYKTTPEWDAEVLKITDGKGANIIVDTGGPVTMDRSLRCVDEGGNISVVGVLEETDVDEKKQPATQTISMSLIRRNVTLKGINVGPRDRIEEMLREVYNVNTGIHPVVDKVFDFDETKDALRYMYGGSHFGKVVIKVSE